MSSLSGRLLAALVLVLALLGAAPNAHADAYEDALQGFVTDDFSDTAEAIEKVAASGDPKAAVVLQALQEGRLVYSAEEKKVYIKDADDKLTDAATGAAVAKPPSDIECAAQQPPARHARRHARRADADVAGRRPGATRRRNPSTAHAMPALPALEKALEAEQDQRVKGPWPRLAPRSSSARATPATKIASRR